MPDSTWHIIFEQGPSGSGGGISTPATTNQAAPSYTNVGTPSSTVTGAGASGSGIGGIGGGAGAAAGGGAIFDFFKQLLPYAGPLIFVIQAIRRSKIFSTFMDTFLTVMSAMVDILMIPLIPLLVPALKLLLLFLPYIKDISNLIATFIKDPFKGIEKLFMKFGDISKGIGDALAKLFPSLGGMFGGIGEELKTMFTDLGKIIGPAFKEIWTIFNDSSKDFWTERLPEIAAVGFKALVESGSVVWNSVLKIWTEHIWPALTENFPVLGVMFKSFKEIIDSIVSVWDVNEDIFTNLNNIVGVLISKYFPDLQTTITNIAGMWPKIESAIKNFIDVTWPKLDSNIKDFLAETWPILEVAILKFSYKVIDAVDWINRKIDWFSNLTIPAPPSIPDWIPDWMRPVRQIGGSIPVTGLYKLHAGEEVIRPSSTYNYNTNKPATFYNNYTIFGDLSTPQRIADSVADSVRRAHIRNW